MSYADLEILIQRWPTGGYAVDMRFRTGDGQSDTELALNVPIALNVAELRGQADEIESYGRALTAMVFADQRLRGAWQRARGFVEGANIPLRIRLRLDPDAAELHAICWEAIFDPDRGLPMGRSEQLLFSRYLDSTDLSRIKLATRDEMQALVVVASPHDLATAYELQPFDAAAESQRVREALGDIPAATMLSGDGGPAVSLSAICEALRFGYAILYLVCHGTLRNLEQLPFSDMEIRRYRQVITSTAEAQAVAKAVGATVVVWGRYTESSVDIQVQAGDRSRFPSIPEAIGDGVLARTGNLSLSLGTSGKLKSIALAALTPINVLKTADGDAFAILRQSAMQDRLLRGVEVAEVQGQSASVWAYRFITNFYSDPQKSLEATRTGLSDDPNNPILLIYRAATYLRLQNLTNASEDVQASIRAVPGWPMSNSTNAAILYAQGNLAGSRDAFDRVIEARPNDWFAYSYRGGLRYMLGDFTGARADLERSIELGPYTSQPYGYAIVIALREGRVADAQALSKQVRERFSGTVSFDNTFYASVVGSENPLSLVNSVFDQIVAGQYGDAIATADRGLAMAGIYTLPPRVSADFRFMRGFAQCNRGDAAGAEESYSAALMLSPEFWVLNLLRADVRRQLGNGLGALEDLNTAAQSPQGQLLQPVIQAAQLGQISCQNILD